VQVLRDIEPFPHAWLDPDVGPMEDAALVRPPGADPLAFTVDFITPIVDQPESYGAIAAANSLSDVYAMGGDPQIALAICGFPDQLPREVLTRIFRGGRDKAAEAGCAIAGGHTVLDPELKYGLCVLGRVDPAQRMTHTHGRPGDRLVLTKPLGFGVGAQALKQRRLSPGQIAELTSLMAALNRAAKDAAVGAGVRTATDVTGFGLLGHLRNLAIGSGLAARVFAGAVPYLPWARGLVDEGLVPGGSRRNLAWVEPHTRFEAAVSPAERLLLADAQTSGGLLLAVDPRAEARLLADLSRRGTSACAVIGELAAGTAGQIDVLAGAPR
jgi:selenide,water dikinase